MEKSGKTTNHNKINKPNNKNKHQSADIIRDNQPLKFRQKQEKYEKKLPQNDINENDNNNNNNNDNNDDDDIWEEGSYPASTMCNNDDNNKRVTIEFDGVPESSKKKRVRRYNVHDKEIAELVHKVHLLCLLARGRLVDAACDDPLIQASLLSLLPPHLLKISDCTQLTAKDLTPLVTWFHKNFHIKRANSAEKPFQSALTFTLADQGGSPEEVAALSVSLFRALNFTARFVSVLDVASLKPDVDEEELSYLQSGRGRKNIFNSSTLMVSKTSSGWSNTTKSSASNGKNIGETSVTSVAEAKHGDLSTLKQEVSETQNVSEDDKPLKRKGDLEFEMQLQMAMSTTALVAPKRIEMSTSGSASRFSPSPSKKLKLISEESPSSSNVISTAIGSRKVGAPLYWAEVYCSGENMTGKWVHIDAVNAIVDGEMKVEDAVAACKKSLRYVIAFAGLGAKDVTRRYCAKWYKISPNRINSDWWDSVVAPLRELELHATNGLVSLDQHDVKSTNTANHLNQACSSGKNSFSESCVNSGKDHLKSSASCSSIGNRSTLEDMELATRALTEPLPTNQQAYRNHPLYAIEKWLTKYQVLHPKGPILGFCSGNAVYPRSCVQLLHTKERWLREGLQVKENELPAKVVKSSYKNRRVNAVEVEDLSDVGSDGNISLFGKWQTEPLCLPHAVNGIVPKNERGQVDVWSEKCLPPGTVHLRFPRLVPVAKRLGINFAPAMVGFEFRSGRSYPIYEGIVVCTEFKEAILEAYAEEEQRRDIEEKKKDERQALSRWYQLLSSMIIRQRLNNTYMNNLESENLATPSKTGTKSSHADTPNVNGNTVTHQENVSEAKIHNSNTQDHEHLFLTDDESYDNDSMTRTKRCSCGVSIQVEEL